MIVERLMLLMTADATKFDREMDRASKKIEKFGKKALHIGAGVTAFGALMVREAAKYDGAVAGSVEKLHAAFTDMAVSIGRALIPVVESLTEALQHMTGFIQNAGKNWEEFKKAFAEVGFIRTITNAMSVFFDFYMGKMADLLDMMSKGADLLGMSDTAGTVKAMADTIRDMGRRGFSGLFDDAVSGFKEMKKMVEVIAPKAAITHRRSLDDLEKQRQNVLGRQAFSESGIMSASGMGIVNPKGQMDAWEEMQEETFASARAIGDWRIAQMSGTAAMDEMRRQMHSFARNGDFEAANDMMAAIKRRSQEFEEANKEAVLGASGSMGAVGGAIEGVAAGGPIGGLIAVIMQFIQPFQKLIDAFSAMLTILMDALAPVLDPVTKMFVIMANMFKAMMPALQMFVAILMPLNLLASAALPALFLALKGFGIVALFVAKQLAAVWNAIFGAFESILIVIANLLAKLKLKGLSNAALTMAQGFGDLQVDRKGIGDALRELVEMSYSDANTTLVPAIVTETEARERSTAAIDKFTEAISNTPSGFKVAAYRYAAADAEMGASVGRPAMALDSGAPIVTVYVGGEEVAAVVTTEQDKAAYQRTGRRAAAGARSGRRP